MFGHLIPLQEHVNVQVQTLRKELVALDDFLESHAPEARCSLRRGASEKELQRLAQKLFGGKSLPPFVSVWFSWHNGQSLQGPALLPLYKLSPFYLPSVSEAIDVHRSYQSVCKHGELCGPWKPQWLPILAGEYGDHLMLETSGAAKGSVRACWHESAKRELIAADLVQLIARIKREWNKQLKEHRADRANAAIGLPVPQGWSTGLERQTTAPTKKDLARDPVGTAYLVGPFMHLAPGTHYLVVKIAPGMWVEACNAPLSLCWESIRGDVSRVPSPCWQKDDSHVALELSSELRIFKHRIRRGTVKFENSQ